MSWRSEDGRHLRAAPRGSSLLGMPAIHVQDVHKSYGDVRAVRGVSFQVEQGEVFCLLGPNGAGKTTITEIVEGHRLPTSGAVRVLGHDPGSGDRGLRDRIGVVL